MVCEALLENFRMNVIDNYSDIEEVDDDDDDNDCNNNKDFVTCDFVALSTILRNWYIYSDDPLQFHRICDFVISMKSFVDTLPNQNLLRIQAERCPSVSPLEYFQFRFLQWSIRSIIKSLPIEYLHCPDQVPIFYVAIIVKI